MTTLREDQLADDFSDALAKIEELKKLVESKMLKEVHVVYRGHLGSKEKQEMVAIYSTREAARKFVRCEMDECRTLTFMVELVKVRE